MVSIPFCPTQNLQPALCYHMSISLPWMLSLPSSTGQAEGLGVAHPPDSSLPACTGHLQGWPDESLGEMKA